MKKIFFFSLMFIFLVQFGTTTWSMGLKLPELPETEMEFSLPEGDISLSDSSSPNSFPNLAEAGENQISSGYWFTPLEIRSVRSVFLMGSNDLYPKAVMRNETWDKIKGTWNGPVEEVILKVTGENSSNVYIWTGIHSFLDAVTDAKAHSRGNMKYFSGTDDWHMWKNCRDVSFIMIVLNFGRRIFIEKITAKEATHDLICVGLIRFVVFNGTYKVTKAGFGAYNDPFYNQRTLPYWGFSHGKLTDKYFSTGRTSTWFVDGGAIGGFILMKTWKW